MNPRRLYRSRDRRLAGVAGGMAEYLDIDPTVMRILWILAGLLSVGFAILAYILLAIVIPESPWSAVPPGAQAMWGSAAQAPTPGWAQPAPGWTSTPQTPGAPPAQTWTGYAPVQAYRAASGWAPTGAQPSGWGTAGPAPESRALARGLGAAGIVGLLLIAIGGIALLNVAIPGWIVPAAVGPIILVLIGGAFLVSSVRRTPPAVAPQMTASSAAPVPPAPAAAATSTGSTASSDEATSIDIPVAGTPGEAGDSAPS